MAVTTVRNEAASRRSVFRDRLQLPVIFVLPFLIVFCFVVIYPVLAGLRIGSDPASYRVIFADPTYRRAIVNTLLYVGVGVNLKLVLALLVSGFFAIPRWWIKALIPFFILPWAIPAVPGLLSIRWMLDSQWGMVDTMLRGLGISQPPLWLIEYPWAMSSAIASHTWKWLPFWTLILLAARMAIPREIYEAAQVDGATGLRRFTEVTFPMLRNVYLTSTLLSTIWTLSDYNTIRFITNGGPADLTQVFATLGIQYAFNAGDVGRGMAVALSALPLLIPLIVVLVRRLGRRA